MPDVPSYSGGYTIQRHGGGRVDALQLELGFDGVDGVWGGGGEG